jgi:hypothetical protein
MRQTNDQRTSFDLSLAIQPGLKHADSSDSQTQQHQPIAWSIKPDKRTDKLGPLWCDWLSYSQRFLVIAVHNFSCVVETRIAPGARFLGAASSQLVVGTRDTVSQYETRGS